MALSLVYQPATWAAAYRPIIWRWQSDLFPCTDPRLSNFAISAIKHPDAAQLALYPQLSADDVLISHGYVDPSAFYSGASIDVYNTANGLYEGVCKVNERLAPDLLWVSFDYNGDDFDGVFRVHFTNFKVFVSVLSQNMTEPVVFPLTAITETEDNTVVFELDCRDVLARTMWDIKKIINPDSQASSTPMIAADGYITQTYSVEAWEGYDVVDADGNTTFTEFREVGGSSAKNFIAVNAVQPYHEQRRDGTIRLDWFDGLDDYLLKPTTTGANVKRLLTHASQSSQFVTDGDGHFMAFLWNSSPVEVKFIVSFYSGKDAQSGTFISSSIYRGNVNGKSVICPMGPNNLTVPANAKSYRFAVFNQNENAISEVFVFNVKPCKGANKRFYYLNKMGGVDAFTFQGDESRTLTATRRTLSKPHMETVRGFFNGDWQERTHRTDPKRRYFISSDFLLPEAVRSVTEPLFESANVFTEIRPGWWTVVNIATAETPADGLSSRAERMELEYTIGVDNVSQRT